MEIEKYIKIAKEKGKSDSEIKSALQEAGWQEELIDKALQGQSDPLPPPPLPTTDKNNVNEEEKNIPWVRIIFYSIGWVILILIILNFEWIIRSLFFILFIIGCILSQDHCAGLSGI